METMTMTQALDEKGFLAKKIKDAVSAFKPITAMRAKDKNTKYGNSVEDFEKTATADYQSIVDNIDRFNRICRAIIKSNATEKISVHGIEMTRAEAIALRTQLKNRDCLELDFLNRLNAEYENYLYEITALNRAYDDKRDGTTNNIIQAGANSEKNGVLTEEDIMVIDKLVEPFAPVTVDPINLKDAIDKYAEKYENLSNDLETAIKISNATTTVEF